MGQQELTELSTLRKQLIDWLLDHALPVWWTVGADRMGGGFHEAIDLQGRPVRGDRRARVQARQIFTYAVSGSLGWTGPYRQAVDHGLDYFIGRYRRPDGLFWNALTPDGAPIELAPHLYEQAFAMLAFATASGTTSRDGELAAHASAVADRLRAERRGAAGGFTGFANKDIYQTDPHMHLLEASLAWEQVAPGDAQWRALADEVVELCTTRFITPNGVLLEHFDSAWTPLPGAAGRIIWPGHHFEWAGLLEKWALARGRDDVRRVARRLYRIGRDYGIDAARGVARFELLDDFTVTETPTRLWVQTEWFKAALILARGEQGELRQRYLADAVSAARALQRYLDVPTKGLWRDKLRADGRWVDEPAPASSFYHVIDALRALHAAPG